MRLERLYRLRFRYPEAFGAEGERFLIAEGRAEGELSGRFRGANRATREPGRPYVPDLNGAIETDDGATVLLRLGGYGRPDEHPRGRVVGWATHRCEDERYKRLNDGVCAVAGEVRREEGKRGAEVVLDVAEIVWEPLDTMEP